MTAPAGYWSSPWPAEDGGPRRRQVPHGTPGPGVRAHERLTATFRALMATTMVVWRDPGELYLLAHTLGPDTVAWVERVDPLTLEPQVRSPDLPGGPMWPGGVAVLADGSLLSVYGTWAHRLDPTTLEPVAARRLPGARPYNSFVVLADGTVATKDFAKDGDEPSTLHLLDPVTLDDRAAPLDLPERSIARLSATDATVYAVGDTHVWRVDWDGRAATLDAHWAPRYRTHEGQTYGWDIVLTDDAGWFLDDGEGTEQYAGTFVGRGASSCPLHLVRVGLGAGDVELREVCGRPGGIIANPPVVDSERGIAVAYDSANAALTAFAVAPDGIGRQLWARDQAHAAHLLLYPDTGELVTHDHDPADGEQVVVLDIASGEERARVATGSPVQSVLFPAPGAARDWYSCSFAGISRVAADA